MAEPTEVITATDPGPEVEPVSIGTCPACKTDVYSGEGVVVDAANARWHPECRIAEKRKAGAKRAASA